VIGFPLLLIPFAIYNMIAFLTPGVLWTGAIYTVPLKSGVAWTATVGDAFLGFALLMLMFEFIKSARQGKSFIEHFLSLCLAGGAAAEFWMVREAGNSTFLLLAVMCFVDLFAGFAVSLRRARHTIAAEPLAPPVAVVRAEPPRTEPARAEAARVEPARSDPFTRIDPPPVRADPAVKIDPVQKVES
jgi:hypothetical protein